ncbi:hypothetical protein [Rhizobium laguerreae]|uniref:hypothetical protein n=1 Tax=Rhizobium laguerreae TaxID=1076926 RepID=UPI001C924CAB|nr:hypothetical protein [Rhizobium laguerreae]MBY3225628.1 hypothetical protein [Rhizobium laguerreae]
MSQILALNGMLTMGREIAAPKVVERADDFKGRHFEAWPIVRAVAWYLGLLKASDEFVRSES